MPGMMMSEKDVKAEEGKEVPSGLRPMGLTFSSFYYAAAGIYYLAYPLLVQDPTIIPLYVLGALSLIGSYGVMKMTRWGVWLGLLLFPIQIIAPAFALQVALQLPGLTQNYEAIAFASSLVVLIFFASLSFLLVLDKRKSFR